MKIRKQDKAKEARRLIRMGIRFGGNINRRWRPVTVAVAAIPAIPHAWE